MYCRFENRVSNHALEFRRPVGRAAAHEKRGIDSVFSAIAHAQTKGWWVALLLNYELGEALLDNDKERSASGQPLITALFFEQAEQCPVWQAPDVPVVLKCSTAASNNHYTDAIQRIRHNICEGEYYQINYTVSIDVHSDASPEQIYRKIASQHPSPHAAFVVDGERTVASFSPELFVKRKGSTLTVRPMKGTRPRFTDPDLDAASGAALKSSAKDCAENVMIVDLLRNDLSQVASPGSVKVETLLELEQYPSVWTMTSTISARQRPETTLKQLLLALFPCGSITGAPKLAAMQAIKELEQRDRGIYCGSIGWIAPNGDLNLNVAIRTLEFQDQQHGKFGVGGGIVYDSDAAQEWQECLWKARILGSEIRQGKA
ncbi:aminodeoxychorismate synthase component I [Paenalcaligenes niemegkensis]|uniref:aminodeoxychorismate synthase component I n=1 Tax=Paenalcaligenes niemegkensis TaxID=2895469 RepID=UPI001EE7CABC|nr:aminodeoxychorismate synthase component I [Paenalcaligenes niemegkensis]MCQ9617128.1 aminodeoxychorismate synthase component I [Paenalcaligenes niemegkensis]